LRKIGESLRKVEEGRRGEKIGRQTSLAAVNVRDSCGESLALEERKLRRKEGREIHCTHGLSPRWSAVMWINLSSFNRCVVLW
jgi:hypothetical protein